MASELENGAAHGGGRALVDGEGLVARIRQWGRELGFDAVGVGGVDLADAEAGLTGWLEAGFHGDMDYMARHGMKRFEGMNPEQRRQARALYGRMKELTPEQRAALRDQWKKMTPEQREAWMQENAPRRRPSREER